MNATVVAAPLVCLDERFGVPRVESDLHQYRHAPRARVFPQQLGIESPSRFREILRDRMGREEFLPVGLHAPDIVIRDEHDGDRIPELHE